MNVADAGVAGRGSEPFIERRVAIDDAAPARLDAEKDLGLGIGDIVERSEMPEMAFARWR